MAARAIPGIPAILVVLAVVVAETILHPALTQALELLGRAMTAAMALLVVARLRAVAAVVLVQLELPEPVQPESLLVVPEATAFQAASTAVRRTTVAAVVVVVVALRPLQVAVLPV